jgi:hypothetical protein
MSYAPSNLTPDNIYLNVRISHQDRSTFEVSPATYDINKTRPIVDKCNDYYCAVLEATVPLDTIPIWIANIVPNQDPTSVEYNPNLMTSIIAIETPLGIYSTNLIFIPETSQDPPVQNQQSMIITSYYFSYNYSGYIQSLNNALQDVFIQAGSPGGGNAPFFYLDAERQLLVLIVSEGFLATDGNGQPLYKIRMNNATLNYLLGFQYFYDQTNNLVPIILILDDIGNISNEYGAEQGIPGGTYRYFKQQYYALESWSSLRRIAIVSTSIPIVNEYLPVLAPDGSNTDVSTSFPVLLDFTPVIKNGAEARNIAYYRPEAQYRLLDLTTGAPLTKINIKVFWVDRLGFYYPLYLQLYQSIDIKLGFFKKPLYNNALTYARIS